MESPRVIFLRPTSRADVPALFEHQSDPGANLLAGTRPRDRAAFGEIWEKILQDAAGPSPGVVPRVIIADDELVGAISVFRMGDKNAVGYWIARPHWGQGVATRAIGLLLEEVAVRPLHAQVAAHNIASLRALERNGFVVISRGHEEGTERYLPGEVVGLLLE